MDTINSILSSTNFYLLLYNTSHSKITDLMFEQNCKVSRRYNVSFFCQSFKICRLKLKYALHTQHLPLLRTQYRSIWASVRTAEQITVVVCTTEASLWRRVSCWQLVAVATTQQRQHSAMNTTSSTTVCSCRCPVPRPSSEAPNRQVPRSIRRVRPTTKSLH